MSFGAPGYLAFVCVAALALFALAWLVRWRMVARGRFGAGVPLRLAPYAAPLALAGAAALAAFAAARPQWGHDETTVEERGIDLMIVLDVSNSMRAVDVQPSRLGRAQEEIGALLERMTGDRAGLVIFAGAPFPRSALTSDLVALRTIVEGVDEELALVPPGSDLGAAIDRARQALSGGEARSKAMLIVSDGEDHGDRIDEALAAVRAAGVRVYTAGAGTAAGASVLDVNPQTGAVTPRTDADGQPVLTRLDADALDRIARAGDGRYVDLGADGRPLAALAPAFEALDVTTFATEETATPIERFQIFTAAALSLVAAAAAVQLLRMPARRYGARLWPVAGAALFVAGICGADAADINRRGNRQYDAGAYGQALSAYRTAQALEPGARELYHNAGNALSRQGEHNAAIDETARGLPADDPALGAILEYALGNHYVNAARLQDALAAYRRSLLADPDDIDAKYNYELTVRRLTPTPTPQPSVTAPEPSPAAPADPGNPGAGGTPGAGTPEPGGSPEPGGEPQDIPPEQLQRLLAEALAGIDDEFSVEEAIRVLELLEERNRDALDEGAAAAPGLPDY
jgi:Ca-activated chloride channel family protein